MSLNDTASKKHTVPETCGIPFLAHGGQAAQPCVYPASSARWWIIAVFSLAAIAQSMTWNVCAPICRAVLAGYGWGDEVISWLANTANIAFLLSIAPMSHLYEKKRARVVMLFSGMLITISTLMRCIPLTGESFTVLFFVSMFLNGLSGSFLNFGGPLLSELWFPDHQRTFATAIASSACYLGSALGFVVGPYVVGDPAKDDHDGAVAAVQRLLWMQAGFTVIVFAAIIIYFPSQPLYAPSEAAAKKRRDVEVQACAQTSGTAPIATNEENSYAVLLGFKRSDRQTVLRFWLLVFCGGVPLGVFQAWQSVLNLNLSGGDIDMSQTESGQLGFWMTVSGCLGSMVVGALLDRFVGNMKTVIMCFYFFSALGFFVLACVMVSIFPLSHDGAVLAAMVSGIAGGFGLNCTLPLFFELTLETVFGVATENAASSILVLFNTIIQILFLAVPTKINGSSDWMNWLTFGSMFTCALAFIPFRVKYNRMMVDRGCDVAQGFDRIGCF